MSIRSVFAKGLDWITDSATTRFAINHMFIGEYGKMIDLKIDNKKKQVATSVLLKGESAPIQINIKKYEIVKADSSASVLVKDASCDREWLDAALKRFVIGKSFNVPAKAIDILDEFLG